MALAVERREVLFSSEVAVLDGTGLVGSRFLELTRAKIAPGSREVDITDREVVRSWVESVPGEVIVNFAGYTDVDGAEKERKDGEESASWRLNVDGARNLAEAAKEEGKFLIQISSGFVFPGTAVYPGPYSEEARPAQTEEEISWYGWTKLKGEEAVQASGARFAIARIDYPYRAFFRDKTDFARKIINLYRNGNLYPMFGDQFITPTFVDEAAEAIAIIGREQKEGIFHVASRTKTTPFNFALELVRRIDGDDQKVPLGSMTEFVNNNPQKAKRPRHGGLDVKATQENLGIRFMTWSEALDEVIRQRIELFGKDFLKQPLF